jgi:hypothetical protein
MRTKAILLAAAVFAAGIGASVAQSPVYSVNAVGYVTKTLTNGFNLICNPLNGTNNDLNTVIPVVPDGTYVLRWLPGGQTFDAQFQYFDGFGWFPTTTLNPGEGVFINIPFTTPSVNVTFVGEVPQGNLTNRVSGNFSLISHIVPQSISLGDPGVSFPAVDGDYILFWDPGIQNFKPQTQFFEGFGWFPTDPIPAVGEGFFYNTAGAARNWARTFSVN